MMRRQMTLLLRLMVNKEEPTLLRGVLQSVTHGGEYPFVGKEALIELLCQKILEEIEENPSGEGRRGEGDSLL